MPRKPNPKRQAYRVKFTRVRNALKEIKDTEHVFEGEDEAAIEKAVRNLCRPYLATRVLEVYVDLEEGFGTIEGGVHAEFTVERIERTAPPPAKRAPRETIAHRWEPRPRLSRPGFVVSVCRACGDRREETVIEAGSVKSRAEGRTGTRVRYLPYGTDKRQWWATKCGSSSAAVEVARG